MTNTSQKIAIQNVEQKNPPDKKLAAPFSAGDANRSTTGESYQGN